ncbi:hypothetical protein AADA15_07205 [Phycobacter sp. 'Weihai']
MTILQALNGCSTSKVDQKLIQALKERPEFKQWRIRREVVDARVCHVCRAAET